MPLYEYRCEHCKKKTEVIQSYSEKPLKICPHCGEKKMKKLASAPAIQFKGSGWYVNDYAAKKPGSESAAESGRGNSDKSETKEKKSDKATTGEKPAKKGSKKD